MRAYLGFIPLAIVLIPVATAAIRQALYYQGCMDGYGYMLLAMVGFIFGGILNCAFLIYVLAERKNYFSYESRGQLVFARLGFIGAVTLAVVQAAVIVMIAISKASS